MHTCINLTSYLRVKIQFPLAKILAISKTQEGHSQRYTNSKVNLIFNQIFITYSFLCWFLHDRLLCFQSLPLDYVANVNVSRPPMWTFSALGSGYCSTRSVEIELKANKNEINRTRVLFPLGGGKYWVFSTFPFSSFKRNETFGSGLSYLKEEKSRKRKIEKNLSQEGQNLKLRTKYPREGGWGAQKWVFEPNNNNALREKRARTCSGKVKWLPRWKF